LEGGPKEVNGDYKCQSCNNLISFKGIAEIIKGNLSAEYNTNIEIVDYIPKEVEKLFYNNCDKLTTLKNVPNTFISLSIGNLQNIERVVYIKLAKNNSDLKKIICSPIRKKQFNKKFNRFKKFINKNQNIDLDTINKIPKIFFI
jgi:hypothetical protein